MSVKLIRIYWTGAMSPLPHILRIPMKIEKEFLEAFNSPDYEHIRRILYEYSLNGGIGPGFRGYIFYTIYEINLLYTEYRLLENKLDRYGKEYLKRSLLKNIRPLRGHFTKLFTIREIKFIRRYGMDSEWLEVKVLSRNPWTKINNYYYRVVIDDAIEGITNSKKSNDVKLLAESLRTLIKVGVELTILYAWLYLIMLLVHSLSNRILGEKRVETLLEDGGFKELSIKLLYSLAESFAISVSMILRMYPHKNHVHSFSSYGVVKKRGLQIDWEGYTERCWSLLFTIYLYKIKLIDEVNISQVCRICMMKYRALYEYIPNGFNRVKVFTEKNDKYVCKIKIVAYYRESVEELENKEDIPQSEPGI